MTSPSTPYFFSETLKARFLQDVREAISSSRIDSTEGKWLQWLTTDASAIEDTAPLPRVDRLVLDDGSMPCAELAGALLITHATDVSAPVILSTPLFGVERFTSRSALLAVLKQRFDEISGTTLALDAELIEGSLFEERMRLIVQQQVRHLDGLIDQLHMLPTLQAAVGKALQDRLDKLEASSGIDVLSHPVLISKADLTSTAGATTVVDMQTMAEIAFRDYVGEVADAQLTRQFLKADGDKLTAAQEITFAKAMSDTSAAVPEAYKQLLSEYWTASMTDGRTVHECFWHALAESFRQALLSSRANRSLTEFECRRLRTLLPSPGAAVDSQSIRVSGLSVVAGEQTVKLAGLCMIEFLANQLPGLYLFSSSGGISRYANKAELNQYFASEIGRTELLRFSSLDEHATLTGQAAITLDFTALGPQWFAACLDSIIALQQRNLRYVLSLPAIGHEQAPVRVDDALDIRELLDCRLLALHDARRWNAGSTDFQQLWGQVQATSALNVGNTDYLVMATWSDKLKVLDQEVARLDELHTGANGCMRHTLNRYLALMDGPRLDARSLWFGQEGAGGQPAGQQTAEQDDTGVQPVHLLCLALRKVCDPDQAALANGKVYGGLVAPVRSQPLEQMTVTWVNHILAWSQQEFAARYRQHLRDFFALPMRNINTQLSATALLTRTRAQALRLELVIERRRQQIDVGAMDMIQQVVDRPLPAQRVALGTKRVVACTLALRYHSSSPPLRLANAFAVYNAAQPAQYAFWSTESGLVAYASFEALQTDLQGRLGQLDESGSVLKLLAEPDRLLLLGCLERPQVPTFNVELQTIDDDFLLALQKSEVVRQCRTVGWIYDRIVSWRLNCEFFHDALAFAEREDSNRTVLDDLGAALQFLLYTAILPRWITEASFKDQVRLTNALQRFYVTCAAEDDFLFSIPDIGDYAREKLTARLKADFPDADLDPEKLIVTLTHYVVAPVGSGDVPQSVPAVATGASETLTDYVVNRFSSAQDGVISIAADDDSPLAVSLTPAYIRDLAQSMDIATHYRDMLDARLVSTDPSYPLRQKIFATQMPAFELLKAFVFRFRHQLSVRAYKFIEAIFDMPDGVARLPVDGRKVVLSPLQLLPAKTGWQPTEVKGVYVICPEAPAPGPWVLYTPLNPTWTFREYIDQAALITDLCSSTSLQAFVLARIEPTLRSIYDNGGFEEPHLPFSTESSMDVPYSRPLPITLKLDPWKGNALEYLFRGAVDVFKAQARAQSVTNAEDSRNSSRHLFGLGLEQLLALLPGRLGALVGLWQSRDLFDLSVVSLREQKWGKALSEFIAGLSVLVSSRQETQADLPGEDTAGEPEQPASFPKFSWHNNALTEELRSRLRDLEATGVALSALRKDELYNVALDDKTSKRYAAVDGRVYEVDFNNYGWFIVDHGKQGPFIKLDEEQHWTLQLQGGLKGGGPVVSRIRQNRLETDINQLVIPEATGMAEIRLNYRDRAQAIEQAHAQARLYLANCLDNLDLRSADGAMDARVERIVGDFFGERKPDARMYDAIRHIVTKVYQEMISPSLSPIDSPRYVLATNRRGHESSLAFIFQKDPLRRVFLTEQFFRVQPFRLKAKVLRAGAFNYHDHYRAMILIHELSHLVANTDDIAYVDSYAPFLDLLDDAPSYRLRLKNEQIARQQKAFSYQTDRSELFKNAEDGVWYDLRRSEGSAKDTILHAAGTKTLEEARDVFYTDVQKRTDIILKNADSVALLISLIGRTRFTTP